MAVAYFSLLFIAARPRDYQRAKIKAVGPVVGWFLQIFRACTRGDRNPVTSIFGADRSRASFVLRENRIKSSADIPWSNILPGTHVMSLDVSSRLIRIRISKYRI
jgi:hypothetical protein